MEKITIPRRLLTVLTAIAIVLSASVAGFATLKEITEMIKVSTLLSTVIFIGIGLTFHKMRKD